MEGEGSSETTQAARDPSVTLNKCISILKSAKSDNERFAALLLVTQLVQSNVIDASQRRELFDAVGFSFINRLLNTRTVPQDCPEGVFKSLAITMLTCFSTDQDLIFHQQMIAKIPIFNEIILSISEDQSVITDVYQILAAFASSAKGCEYLMSHGTVPSLCQVVRESSSFGTTAFELLLRMLHFHSAEIWLSYSQPMIELLCYFSEKLNTLQDLTKFDACKTLLSLISGVDKDGFVKAQNQSKSGSKWKADALKGIKDIIQSKVKPEQRDPALILLSAITDLSGGLDLSVLGAESAADFFVFTATLVSIEIQLVLEESAASEINSKSPLLIACYAILESIITELITAPENIQPHMSTENDSSYLNAEVISKVYSQVTEVMRSVLKFIQEEAVKNEMQEIADAEKDFLLASARVLCCWLAEESLALQDNVLKVLPFLIKLSEESMESAIQDQSQAKKAGKKVSFQGVEEVRNYSPKNVEILRFMLPALCHLSAADKARKILIDNHVPRLLAQYYSILWNRWSVSHYTDNESKTALITLAGVLLNFAVTEPELVKDDESFCSLQSHITKEIPQLVSSSSHIVLTANLLVLGLMLTRHQKTTLDTANVTFYKSAVHFLRENKHSPDSGENVDAELWSLGVQVLSSSAEQSPVIKELVKDSKWMGV